MLRIPAVALLALFATEPAAFAQTANTTGSAGCAAIVQAAANGMTSRMAADAATINQPQSVTTMSCLDNFFNGTGLNLITNLLSPTNLLKAVEGQICNALKSAWNSWTSGVSQCGITVTGFNLGFGGLGGGFSCPKLSFGGGGPPIGTIGLGFGGLGGLYIHGIMTSPPGYTIPSTAQGTF